ncbi:hypothetical protein CEP54_015848 [Fusarium duplospermum]|uniref:Uncharacterized protein n=1 Tax=Fusarium duplospermum TaxID=1325734 RepID=A0A428NKM2_9HYPO|nr:hypothetical protein CEP54_015848 [Fusarium duplospermum]
MQHQRSSATVRITTLFDSTNSAVCTQLKNAGGTLDGRMPVDAFLVGCQDLDNGDRPYHNGTNYPNMKKDKVKVDENTKDEENNANASARKNRWGARHPRC